MLNSIADKDNPSFVPAPEDVDSYTVVFIGGSVSVPSGPRATLRPTIRGIGTRAEAVAHAAVLDAEYGRYGRRALIYAICGVRSFMIPRN